MSMHCTQYTRYAVREGEREREMWKIKSQPKAISQINTYSCHLIWPLSTLSHELSFAPPLLVVCLKIYANWKTVAKIKANSKCFGMNHECTCDCMVYAYVQQIYLQKDEPSAKSENEQIFEFPQLPILQNKFY